MRNRASGVSCGVSWPRSDHSALGEAVEAGPQGSQFVSPSSLPPDTAAAPLGTSATGNYDVGTANIG
jgi:hypothetical protein